LEIMMGGFTNFPNGITSLGIPTFGSGGMVPPFPSKYCFVEELTTAGVSAGIGSATSPFNTLAQALASASAGSNDVIFLTGSVHVTASVAWNLNNVHLVGLCGPLQRGKRARLSITGSTAFGPLMNVTGAGCIFENLQAFFGYPITGATTPICWEDNAGHSTYNGVEFLGFGDGTVTTGTANQTGARAFKFNSATGESTFRSCVFGVDTIQRNATNYTVEIAGGAPRITFDDCDFESDLGSSGTAGSHILIGVDGIDRYLNLKHCRFLSSVLSGGSTMAQVFNVSSSAGGVVLMNECVSFGATAWETSPSGSVYYDMLTPAASQAGGKAVEL
jgi:hypothetical protein